MTTELKKFIAVKNGWHVVKSTTKIGVLIYDKEKIARGNFALLQFKKKELIKTGNYRKDNFRITYDYE